MHLSTHRTQGVRALNRDPTARLRREPSPKHWALEFPGSAPVTHTHTLLRSSGLNISRSVAQCDPRPGVPHIPQSQSSGHKHSPRVPGPSLPPQGTYCTLSLDWHCPAWLQAPRAGKEPSAPLLGVCQQRRPTLLQRCGWVGPPEREGASAGLHTPNLSEQKAFTMCAALPARNPKHCEETTSRGVESADPARTLSLPLKPLPSLETTGSSALTW